MDKNKNQRKEKLYELAQNISNHKFVDLFVENYVLETSFSRKDIINREIIVPAKLLNLIDINSEDYINRCPLGKVAVLIPKNSIGLTVVKAIASSYLMGNKTIVYFPSSIKKTAKIYQELLTSTLDDIEVVDNDITSAAFMRKCINSKDVDAIVVYGDDCWIDAYKKIALQHKTKIIFEGPGNDPMIVFQDSDLKLAAEGAIRGGLNNGGQSCSAIERFFVHEKCLEEFLSELIEKLKIIKLGTPNDLKTDIGPIASNKIFSRIIRQIKESVEMGAVVKFGGSIIKDEITNLPILEPTVLINCDVEFPIVKEETFGPVFPIVTFNSEIELLHLLDNTKYGLNACSYGTTPINIVNYLENSHRNVYYNSTPSCMVNLSTRLMDGGYGRSGFIWDFDKNEDERTGIRKLSIELSKKCN